MNRLAHDAAQRCWQSLCRALKPKKVAQTEESSLRDVLLEKMLDGLREKMDAYGLAAYVVPTDDPHQSEYVADCFNRRSFLSGFTGSAGTCVVTHKEALLWTDGRYFAQARARVSVRACTGVRAVQNPNCSWTQCRSQRCAT
jgi:Xaa-Pro aminopeptidase